MKVYRVKDDYVTYLRTKEERVLKNKNERKQEEKKTADAYSVHRIPWWKTLLVIIGIIGVITLVFAIVGGIISLIAPFILPVLIIITIVRLIKRDK